MLRWLIKRRLARFERKYDYDVDYLRSVTDADPLATIRFGKATSMSRYRRGVPAAPYHAARLRATLREDCGPCAQLAVEMASEDGVEPDVVAAVVAGRFGDLPDGPGLAARFAEAVLDRRPEADRIRSEIRALWGDRGLVSLGFAITSARIYPTLKYALGFGRACTRLSVGDREVAPRRSLAGSEP